jgi:hypothetical protein
MIDIVFDIDLTLIQSIWASKEDIKSILNDKELLNSSNLFIVSNNELDYAKKNYLIQRNKTRKSIKTLKLNISNNTIIESKSNTIKKLKKETHLTNIQNIAFIVFIRPYVKEILNWCFENARVSFWTSGDYSYAITIIKHLVQPKYINKIKTIITRYSRHIYIDLYTNKKYSVLRNGVLVKNMDLLFENENFKHKFNRRNTILIDDLAVNILENIKSHNKYNIIPIEPWFYKDVGDIRILELLQWLMLMKKNNKIDIRNQRPLLV